MKKMNKTETEAAAKKHAGQDTQVKDVTLADLRAMPYEERQQKARTLAGVAYAAALTADQGVREDWYVPAYAAAAADRWHRMEREWDGRVKRFERARSGITLDAATEQVRALLTSMNVRGGTVSNDGMSLHVTRAWGADGSVYFTWRRSGETLENPEVPGHTVHAYELDVNVSWGSTSRGVADAVTAVNVYRDLIDAGAEVVAVAGRLSVVYEHGAPPAPAAEGGAL